MATEPEPRHQGALKVLGFVFPLTAILALIAILAMYIGFPLGDVNAVPKGQDGTPRTQNAVPKGQDGTPRTQQVRTDGMLETPLNYYEQEGKKEQSSTFDILSPVTFQLNDLIQASAKPIINYAKGHDGELPDEAEGASLLSTVKKVYEFNLDTTQWASDKSVMRFEITKYTYHPLPEGIFSIDYDWEYSMPNNRPKDNPDWKATGTFMMQYTANGMIAWNPNRKESPFDEILQAVRTQSDKEEAREREAAKDAKKKSASGKSSGG